LTAIIVAAGSSRRLGFDKLTALLAGKPLILHTVTAFEQTRAVDEIIVVTREDRLPELERIFKGLPKIRAIVIGVEHRHISVEAGLRQLSSTVEYVAVHDGARPLVRHEQIEQVFQQAQMNGAASIEEP